MLSRSLLTAVPSILILLFFANYIEAQYQGDACTANGSPGICTRLQQCPRIYNNLMNGQFPQAVCGYSSFEPIVCCPRTTATTVAPPPPVYKAPGVKAAEMCRYYYDHIPKFIVGGTKAIAMEFTFMAAVGFDSGDAGIAWLCGGSLISERFVVTAAHCTYNKNWGSANWVRLGAKNLEETDQVVVTLRVIERIIHPWYKRPAEYHDIALLKLERNVTFGPFIKPCCLANSLPDVGTTGQAIAMGWGQVDWGGESSSDLLKVTLNLVPQPTCNSTFTRGVRDNKLEFGIVGDWQICAGGLGKDTCQGDSGGPLVILNDTIYLYNLIGVTSLGKVCGSIIPGIYTRVYNYVSWIENIVWPN